MVGEEFSTPMLAPACSSILRGSNTCGKLHRGVTHESSHHAIYFSSTASLGQPVNIEVKNVFKIFGTKEKIALEMVRNGSSKDDVLAKTNCTVGLNDVSLHIGSGKIFVIMGLSGSGKSTLVRHFNGLIQPSSGEVMMDGVDVAKLDEAGLRELRRSKVSMVFKALG
jgi:ABC-type glutathione transport system ATPase component